MRWALVAGLFLNAGCRLVDGQDPGVQTLILNSMTVSAKACASEATVAEAFSCQPDVTMPENMLDVTSSQLTWELTSENTCTWIQINPTTGQLFGVPPREFIGSCVLALRVVTAEEPSSDFVQPLTIRGPKLSFVDLNCPLTAAVDGSYVCVLKTETPLENAVITYTLASDNNCLWAGIDSKTGVITGSPSLESVGSCSLSVVAMIDKIASAPMKMTINVPQVAVNISASCASTVDAGVNYSCLPRATAAVSNPTFTWNITSSNTCSWATINPVTGAIAGTPQVQSTGSCRLDFTAKLPNGSMGQYSTTVAIGIKGYTQIALNDLNAEANDNTGRSVAIDGNYAIVGSPNANGGAGSATVYQFNGTGWQKQAVFAPPDTKMRSFGHAVAISGPYILVGAPDTTNFNTRDGSIVAYERSNSNGSWAQTQVIIPTQKQSTSQLNMGSSLDLDGTNAIVGNSHFNGPAAFIMARPGVGWEIMNSLSFTAVGSANGTSRIKVAIQGTTAAVADNVGGTSQTGEVRVYRYIYSTWTESGVISAPAGTGFASSVDTYGGKVLIGSSKERSGAGGAYLYEEGQGAWIQTQAFRAIDETASLGCGSSVSLTSGRAAMGCASILKAGAAYIYTSSNATWSLESKFVPSASQPLDRFGSSISISGTNIIVGAEYYDAGSASNAGTASIFKPK